MAVPTLKAFGVTPVSDERIVQEGNIVTGAGVSAGIDLGMWLAAQIGGEARARAIQLAIEYDPQPPFDSGHLSKASAATKASATAMMSRDLMKPAQLKATTLVLWDQAIRAARSRGKKRRPAVTQR
jgi:transcriptional regulator GlxA family with amidase domain